MDAGVRQVEAGVYQVETFLPLASSLSPIEMVHSTSLEEEIARSRVRSLHTVAPKTKVNREG